MMSFNCGKFMFGLFPYWLGFSNRDLRTYRVIDAGFLKVMWVSRSSAASSEGK